MLALPFYIILYFVYKDIKNNRIENNPMMQILSASNCTRESDLKIIFGSARGAGTLFSFARNERSEKSEITASRHGHVGRRDLLERRTQYRSLIVM